ncbi:cytochrome c oxidase accessory protein CcoG [Vibrio profundum]|uniref:cytochrome c oxidase accessory protein CcoG n=1 Tax=Vibrio profundum TaxID=2910247 RepID=UPI003D11FF3C
MSQDKIDIKQLPPDSPHSGKIYVRASQGYFQKLRRLGAWFFLLLFFLTPWLNYHHRPAILIDVSQQHFYFFSTTLYPQDLLLLALLFILAAFGLFFLTTFLGRVWCGFLCPQTVWTFLFIWFEEKLEGSANKRRRQDSQPMTSRLLYKKTLKHLAWLFIALATGIAFIGYFIPIRQLTSDMFSGQITFWPAFWIALFSGCTYANAGWLRSIMCLHICPYARFQSAMFDRDTFIVGYDNDRGERRGPRSKRAKPSDSTLGDCIDCNLCVQVCPTGIDIRNGLQYECINCGACVDACNHTMDKMGYPANLISYTTERKLAQKKNKILRPKLMGYGAVLLLMLGLFTVQIESVEPAGMSVLRDRNQLARTNPSGEIENTYTLKIINKTQTPQQYSLSVVGLNKVSWYGKQSVRVQPGEVLNLPLSLGVKSNMLSSPVSKIQFILSDNRDLSISVESRFIKPLSPNR